MYRIFNVSFQGAYVEARGLGGTTEVLKTNFPAHVYALCTAWMTQVPADVKSSAGVILAVSIDPPTGPLPPVAPSGTPVNGLYTRTAEGVTTHVNFGGKEGWDQSGLVLPIVQAAMLTGAGVMSVNIDETSGRICGVQINR